MAGLAGIVDTQSSPEQMRRLLDSMLQSLKAETWYQLSGQVLDWAAMGRVSLEILNPGPSTDLQ